MRKILIITLVCLILSLPLVMSSSEDMIVLLGLNINKNDTAEIKDLVVRYGFPDKDYGLDLDYKQIIYDQNNNKLVEMSFLVPFTVMPHFLDPEMTQTFNVSTVYMMFRLPYNTNYKKLEVKHGQKTILSSDIGQLLCNNNGKCDGYENYLSCSQDCDESSKDGFCEKIKDNFCDADCEKGEDPDCKQGGCGDGVCEETENHNTCPQDCASGIADNYCDKIEDNRCDPDCYQEDPDCLDYKPPQIIKPPQKKDMFSTKTILIVVLFVIISLVILVMFYMIHKQKGKSYLERRGPRREQQPSQTSAKQESPFDKYKYMFKQQNSIRKK